ncbi:MAG: hypothetical protein ACQEUT_09925 [Bacillota bacterium]
MIHITSKIFLFSHDTETDSDVLECIEVRLRKLYDIKQINDSAYLIKTEDDIALLDKYLSNCFTSKEKYFIVNITDQPKRHNNKELDIDWWMDNI